MPTWIANKLAQQQTVQVESELAARGVISRRERGFDRNNYERALNDLSGRLTTSASQRLAVAQKFGGQTSGLIIGGRRDTRDERGPGNRGRRDTRDERGPGNRGPKSTAPQQDYVNPVTGTVILPGTGTKPPSQQPQSGSGSKTPTQKPPKTGAGGLQGPP